ncbi:MAG: hypothetical protein ACK5HR_03085 [Mycoplasmatales bacterium]
MSKKFNKNLKEDIIKYFDNIYNDNFFKTLEPKKRRVSNVQLIQDIGNYF